MSKKKSPVRPSPSTVLKLTLFVRGTIPTLQSHAPFVPTCRLEILEVPCGDEGNGSGELAPPIQQAHIRLAVLAQPCRPLYGSFGAVPKPPRSIVDPPLLRFRVGRASPVGGSPSMMGLARSDPLRDCVEARRRSQGTRSTRLKIRLF